MFRPNPRLAAELKADPATREALLDRAQTVAQITRGLTPHAPESVSASADGDTVTAGSDDPFFHLVEWGSVNNQAYAPLRRAVRAAGLRFEETGP